MKVLISYSSNTGNTEKVAGAIYNAIKDEHFVDMFKTKDIKEADLSAYDIVFIGFWVDRAFPDRMSLEFIKNIKNKRVGLFGTIGANPDSYHGKKTMDNLDTILGDGSELMVKFLCNGKVDENLIKKLEKIPKDKLPPGVSVDVMQQMIDTGKVSREPNEEDFRNAEKTFINALKSLEELN